MIRQEKFPDLPYKNVSNALTSLVTRGVLRKKTEWDGQNHVVYEVVDNEKKPTVVNLNKMYASVSSRPARGAALYKYRKALREKTASIPQDEEILKTLQIIEKSVSDLLKKISAKERISLDQFKNQELWDELARRNKS